MPTKKTKKPTKFAREPRLALPEDRPKRVEKTAYLPPEVEEEAEARRRALGISWSSYVNKLVREDLEANRDGRSAAE